MSSVLATFSGKFGDILWSLATVKMLSARYGKPIDFACMPQYKSLIALLDLQPYIQHAFVLTDWQCTGSPHGDQPWQAPVSHMGYQDVFHLTYQRHPHPTPLALYIAQQAGVQLDGEPFIDLPNQNWEWVLGQMPYVAWAFNPLHAEAKAAFFARVQELCQEGGPDNPLWPLKFVNVADHPWKDAAQLIKGSFAFLGCRSANYVIAHGVGKRVLSYEPEPWRLDPCYSYPYGTETVCMNPETAVNQLREWLKLALPPLPKEAQNAPHVP